MSDIPLKPLCYVEDVKIAVHTAFQRFYDDQEKYSNLKQLMELVYEEFRKIQTYTPEFASRSKEECQDYIEKKNWHCPECSTGLLQETAFLEEGKTVKVIGCNKCRYNIVEREK